MSKRIETSIIIDKPLDIVWQEVKVMENHVNWMEDAVKIDILSENNSGINTKMNVLTKVGPIKLTDIITVTEWKEKESIGVIHEGIVTGEGIFYLTELNESQTEFRWEETLKFPIYLGGVIGEFFGSYVLKYIWKKFTGNDNGQGEMNYIKFSGMMKKLNVEKFKYREGVGRIYPKFMPKKNHDAIFNFFKFI